MSVQVYELVLEEDGSPSKELSYVRLPAPTTPAYLLRISIAAGSAASKNGILFTSYPPKDKEFVRSTFYPTKLPSDISKSIEIDIAITRPGVFEFYVEYETRAGPRAQASRCYFNVDPTIEMPLRSPILDEKSHQILPEGGKVQKQTTKMPLDGLVIQSVVSKWMGNLEEWQPHLELMSKRGYNMLHFPPLQARGISNSPYSLADQLDYSDDLFTHLSKKQLSPDQKVKAIQEELSRIRTQYGMLSMIDIVLNHTANTSDWLLDHPDAGYNIVNSPHLEPALVLDRALFKFSQELKQHGLPQNIQSEADLNQVVAVLKDKILPEIRLWEYYVIDVTGSKATFEKVWSKGIPKAVTKKVPQVNGHAPTTVEVPEANIDGDLGKLPREEQLDIFQRLCLPKNWRQVGGKFHIKLDPESAVRVISKLLSTEPSSENVGQASRALESILNDLNVDQYKTYDDDVKSIVEQTTSRVRYQRLEPHGPKLGICNTENPLVDRFFTELPNNERTAKHDPRVLALACNGWIWNADPLQDFASAGSRAYLRREVIAWGDCVKLRFGGSPDDSPYLWERMTKYAETMAATFDGFRIDNCHSTPIHVGERLLDAARRVNPNLYVCAELFTGSEETDTYFVKRLGLNSLIREAMNGNDPKDMSRLLYIYGVPKPVGSMDADCLTESNTVTIDGKSQPCLITPLTGSKPHAFIMDCTHDNEAPNQKRTAEDAVPTGSLVAFSYSAVGSNRGYDDFYGKHLNVVTDSRHYELPGSPDSEKTMGGIKRILNHLHAEMVLDGFTEGHLHQENDYIFTHRVHPKTHKGYLLLAHCAFSGNSKERGNISPIELRGQNATCVFAYTIDVESREDPNDPKTMKGLPAKVTPIQNVQAIAKSDGNGPFVQINVPDIFPPGSVALFQTWAEDFDATLQNKCISGATEAFSQLDLVDLNIVLFRADGEERDLTDGQDGTYSINGLGSLPYCGLEGWMHPLRHIMLYNDLGHPLCAHLRDGAWPLDYVEGRLRRQSAIFPRLKQPADWFKERFDGVRGSVPSFLRPKYFAMIVNEAYKAARDRALACCSPFVRDGHSFTHALTLTAVQMHGQVKSASLDPFKATPSLAAGLPHFTAGWARSWGRDVCISIRGLLLVTGQFEAARAHLIALASTLKHGLVPNLLDSVKTPRYNSRDSPWWFAQNVQDYVVITKDEKFLQTPVKRRFPKDDEWVAYDSDKAYSYTSTVAEVLQEMLQRHATGIHFREYNAGSQLDMQMKDNGFNIDIEVDWETGLMKGGNADNCGTWMDKMGESERAGTRGVPGTPRDGAPVEITGLLKSTLRWVNELSKKGKWPAKGVEVGKRLITYAEWDALLQKSFEKEYYVPEDPKEDSKYNIISSIVARRGIYKDVVGSGKGREYSDYQLRANFPIAMAVAPELFDAKHAVKALEIYRDVLWGPLGVKTLDPKDDQYRPNYDNSNDSTDPATAKGRNYHQGPEWCWPGGYFLRAYLHFNTLNGNQTLDETTHAILGLLSTHREHIRKNKWAGLPELTNENGAYCHDSCTTQAWSSSTILDVLYDIYQKGN